MARLKGFGLPLAGGWPSLGLSDLARNLDVTCSRPSCSYAGTPDGACTPHHAGANLHVGAARRALEVENAASPFLEGDVPMPSLDEEDATWVVALQAGRGWKRARRRHVSWARFLLSFDWCTGLRLRWRRASPEEVRQCFHRSLTVVYRVDLVRRVLVFQDLN